MDAEMLIKSHHLQTTMLSNNLMCYRVVSGYLICLQHYIGHPSRTSGHLQYETVPSSQQSVEHYMPRHSFMTTSLLLQISEAYKDVLKNSPIQ